jgi:hypothetical protein
MTIKEWVQLAFGLCNGLSFALTIRHNPRAKIVGSLVLVVAHPGIAVYFVLTHQAVFLLGNAIMTLAGVYGAVRGYRALQQKQGPDEGVSPVPETTAGPLADTEEQKKLRSAWWIEEAHERLKHLDDEVVLEELLRAVTDRLNTVKGHNG